MRIAVYWLKAFMCMYKDLSYGAWKAKNMFVVSHIPDVLGRITIIIIIIIIILETSNILPSEESIIET